ncbi:hypothetical protein J3A83DRAFT_4101084 [Scleroderma citrinum]
MDSGRDVPPAYISKQPPTLIKYTNDVVNFDHWDHMFITSCCKSLTLHHFDTPPTSILDLGCGRGLWAIEAARQWKGSTVVGFDIAHVQPPLNILDKIAPRRLRWVHGNFLDRLPFDDRQFDFVRMVRVGLHVPVDEWRHVLEEVSRVLKPNGVFEIIEEDPIFPCQTSQVVNNYPVSKRSSSNGSSRSSNTTMTTISSPYVTSDSSLRAIGSKCSSADGYLGPVSNASAFEAEFSQPKPPDPRDHSRLKRAWEEMLDDCVLSPNLLSILESQLKMYFSDIRSHPPLSIPLPPNSSQRRGSPLTTCGLPGLIDPDALFELSSLTGTPTALESDCISVAARKSSQRGVSSWASMHLARTVRTITGCKESIWQAYEKLYGRDPSLPHMVRSAQERYLRRNPHQALSPTNPIRDFFERDWMNWESDMIDRTSLRSNIRSELSWNEPSGRSPEWRIWNSVSSCETESEENPELCRNLRGFVCFKGSGIAR